MSTLPEAPRPAVFESLGSVATGGTLPPAHEARTHRKSNRNFWYGLLAIVSALGVAVYFIITNAGSGKPNAFVYFPADIGVQTGTRVLYLSTDVGAVTEVRKVAVAMQLVVSSLHDPARKDVHTVLANKVDTLDGITWSLDSTGRTVAIAWRQYTMSVAYNPEIQSWMLAPPRSVPCTINGVPAAKFDTAKIGKALHTGDIFGFGDTTIEWHEPGAATFAAIAIDVQKLLSQVDNGQYFGPGATIEFVTNLGLTHPTLKLNTAFKRAGAPPAHWELIPITAMDLQAIANKLTNYLFAESKAYAPPTDRFERGVNDLNNTLSSIDTMTSQLQADLATKTGELPKNATAIAGIVNDLEKVTASLKPIAPTANSLLARVDTSVVPGVMRAIDSTIAHVNALLKQGTSLVHNLDSNTIPAFNNTVAGLQPQVRALLIQVQIVLKGVLEAVRKVRDFIP